ncbi:hypothetical protein H4F99_01185 [Lysobacter sp. SG-8]|uniref:Uncharacterized protein n=1 Tax=Marilutibacter penaei TaxID=2759900 RepID=A0A7W3U188_9GAMM|nr:hypothetical protein [Lysobacter penaei]MBB1087096.1 hypothetical protein [Lysobacter penaei]
MSLSEFTRFLSQSPEPGVVDIVVDSTERDGAAVPVLVIGLYRPADGTSIAEAARMAYDNGDDGFFYDELELTDDCEDVEVAEFYPRWPHERDKGDAALMHALCEAIPRPADGNVRRTYLFHHVDDQPYLNVLTGKPFALRG